MFYVLRPQSPYTLVRDHPVYVDPEDAYVESRRREYVAALQQQQQRLAYEQAVAAEEERHRARLGALAQQERMRRHAAHRQSLPPHALRCAGPPCAPTNIVRGRYNRQRESPHFHTPTSAPVPQPSRTQSEEISLDRLLAELFGHSAHHEPEVIARQSTAVPQQAPHANPESAPVASTSAAPPPAAAPAPAEQSEGHWSDAVKRTRSVVTISKISRTFDSLKRAFTFPAGPLAPVPGSEAPRLAYNPTNAPIHAYEHALSELLTGLDAIESFGFRGVRELRKEVVVKIEKELEALEKQVAEAIAAGASPVIKATEVVPEEPATEHQADKVAEDIVIEEAEVAAVVASDDTEEISEGYDLVTDDTVTIVPAPAPTPAPDSPTLAADSPIVDAGAQTVTIEIAQPKADAFTFVPTPTEPKEDTIEAEPQAVDVDPIITEPAVEPEPESASQITGSSAAAAVVATAAPEPLSQTALADTTASSSAPESETEDAVDVTVSSDSDVEVTPEADDAASDAGAEKDYEML